MRIVANELRRDAGRMHERNDTFTIALDTFFDGRNGYIFYFNPYGAVADWACWDEGRVWSQDWDTVWNVRTTIESSGWTAEVRLPFRSLRFETQGPQRWGINFRRIVLAKNEWVYATPIPPEWAGQGIGKFSSEAVLEGLEIGRRSLNLELHPYVLGGAVQLRCETGDCPTEVRRDQGIDAKYGLTPNLTLDLTYNTDFSQIEADEQQVNFTRFSLFFPEKRQFFLEGKGIFDFGVAQNPSESGDYRLLPFFSRRVGLEGNEPVPIVGGTRLTGKAGSYSVGALAIRTGEDGQTPAATYSVVRLKRDVLGRSSLGFIAVDRREASGANDAIGADALFAFGSRARIEGLMARAWTATLAEDSWAGRLHAVNENDRYAMEIDYLRVGRNFDPQAGFVRRRDIDRWFGRVQASPRIGHGPVRKAYGALSLDYVRDGAARLESRDLLALFKLEFHSADVVQVTAGRRIDSPRASFRVGRGLQVAPGSYAFNEYIASWDTAKSRRLAGRIQYRDGGYYDGRRRELSASATLKGDRHFYADVNYQVNDVRLAFARAVAHLLGVRLNYSATAQLYGAALVQWNNSTGELDINARLGWRYRPGSSLYVVYSRTSETLEMPRGLRSQSLLVKFTPLIQF
ncbi:MAG: hypothetical protein HYU53_12155 [Acidobacteria bacterium]|nr:hypothetical protein [Acidobacteriota bacterium]